MSHVADGTVGLSSKVAVAVAWRDQAELSQPLEHASGVDLGMDDGRLDGDGALDLLPRLSPGPIEDLRGGADAVGRVFGLELGDERLDGLGGGIGERIPRLLLGLVAAGALRLRALRLAAAAIGGRQFVARIFSEVQWSSVDKF
jgi:hypothetical protein